jgi:hypothetical protein
MKLEEIFENWDKDSNVDRTELGNVALDIPKLHHKYFKIFSHERLLLRKLEQDMKKLKRLKWEYYTGVLDQESMEERGWEPFGLKILKQDVPTYIDSDNDIINLNLRIAVQQEKIDALESIIKAIMNLGFQVKSAIDWAKFTSGQ